MDISDSHLSKPRDSTDYVETMDKTASPPKVAMEQMLPLGSALRSYPMAVMWCVIISASLIMESYDTLLVTQLPANPVFAAKFGVMLPGGAGYQLKSTYQSLLGVGPTVGEVIGLLINGWLAERLGHRKMILISLILTAAFLFTPFFSNNIGGIIAGFFLIGIPFGVLQTACVAYASEVCPVSLRAQLTTYTNLCWAIGQLIAAGAFRGTSGYTDVWSYKIPMVIQWVWPLPIAIGVILAPDSPWWLLRHGRPAESRKALRRLANSRYISDADIDAYMLTMEDTIAHEATISAAASESRYIDCFRGPNLRRTETVVVTWLNQILCGTALVSYSAYFFQQVGLSVSTSFTMTMVLGVIGVVGTMASWLVMIKLGRRTIYLVGSIILSAITLSVGIASAAGHHSSAAGWAQVGLMMAWQCVYNTSIGPVCYAIVSEMPSARLRSMTMVLGCAAYNCGVIVVFFLIAPMLNPGAWNWGGKAGFFWGGISCFIAVWVFFRLPEPKGRTFRELDILFERKTPARKFKTTNISEDDLRLHDTASGVIEGLEVTETGKQASPRKHSEASM